MSVIETLHQARKARLQRMASRAVPQAAEPVRAARLVAPTAQPVKRIRPREIDRDYERAWAAEIMGVAPSGRLRLNDILRATAQHFGIPLDEMIADRHARKLAQARHVAMYLAKQLTPKSFAAIGRACGRDHSTVVHAVAGIERRLAADGELAHHIAHIRDELAAMRVGGEF